MLKLDDQARHRVAAAVRRTVNDHVDEPIGQLKAELIAEALIKVIGPIAYNQALLDAQTYLQGRLVDMEIDLREDTEPRESP